jgi:serine/threonine-protein kinase
MKVLFPEVAKENSDYVKRFLREAKIATRIRHPNLVAVHDCGYDEERGLYYLVMDYISGGDLRQALAFAGRFAPDRAVEVVLQVASALDAAQKYHVVHRDIKPENIMIQPDGLVKLVDLGIAKADDIKDSLCTEAESVFGTPAYVAPEQAIDASVVDVRADIYSLGVVLFEMIAGKVPFDGPNAPQILVQTLSSDPFPDIRDINPDVSPQLAVIIRRMCVKEPDRRIPTPAALIKEFEKIGYRLKGLQAAADVKFAHQADSAPTLVSMRSLIGKGEEASRGREETLSFETQDVEIQDFVNRVKRRKKLKKLAGTAALLALGSLLGLLLLAWIFVLV